MSGISWASRLRLGSCGGALVGFQWHATLGVFQEDKNVTISLYTMLLTHFMRQSVFITEISRYRLSCQATPSRELSCPTLLLRS